MYRHFQIIIFFVFLSINAFASDLLEESVYKSDSVSQIYSDSVAYISAQPVLSDVVAEEFRPNVAKIVWMGAIIPGYGQILNRKYWKLPIVYAGLLGCVYGISWNQSRYQSYKMAFRDISGKDPNATSYLDILPQGTTMETFGGREAYKALLESRQNSFRRYRDLSVVVSIAVYGLSILDAYVDAQLYDFDISPDLSMSVQPAVFNSWGGKMSRSFGMQISFNLK